MAKTTIHSDYIPDNAITSTKIAENSIGAREIATNAITTLYVADGSVTTVKIADDAITSAKLDTNIDIAGTFDVTGVTTLDSTLSAVGNTHVNSGNGTGTAFKVGGEAGSGIKTQYVFSGSTQHNWQLGFATHTSQVMSITPSSAVGNTTFTTPILNLDGANSRVGIGTSSPSRNLTVKVSSGQEGIELIDADYSLFLIQKSGSSANTSYVSMMSGGNTTVRLHADNVSYFNGGNVGIGTSSPSAILDIRTAQNSTSQFTSPFIKLFPSSTTNTTGFTGITYGTSTSDNYGWSVGGLRTATSADVGSFVFNFHNNSASGSEKMRIDSSGNVGIGTATPQKKFHIEHTAGASEGILISGASDTAGHTAGILLRAEGGEADSALRAKAGIFLERTATYGIGKLHIANRHNSDNVSATISDAQITIYDNSVGIGTSSPDGELHVLGTGGGNGDIYVERTSGAKIHLQAQSANGKIGTSSNHNLGLNTNGTTRVTIDTNGKVLIGDTASHTDDLLQIETPASGGGHGIQIRRNDSNTDQGIGHIQFGNNTDTDLAKISAKTDGSVDNAALLFSTQNDGGALNERMRINHDGEVGIATTNPESTLHVAGTTRSDTYDIGSTESQFGLDRYKIRELNNLLYAADKRFGGVSGSSNLQTAMFDGNHDNGYTISQGTTYVVTINLNQTITYPAGDAYISFYHIYNDFQSVSGRMYYTAGPNSGTWQNMGAAETIRGSAGSGSRLVKLSGAGGVYVGKFEFTFVAKSTQDLIVTDIAFFGTRVAGRDFRPYLRTDTAQNLTEDITFKNSATGTVGSIVVGGGSTAFNTSSDYRLKENVLQITNATDKVNQLNPITFNWISDDTDTPISGFLAHEVQEVVPEAVTGEKDAIVPPELFTETDPLPEGVSVGDIKDPRGQIDPQQVDHSKLVPLLTKAIQEQQTIIDDLKSRLDEAGL